MSRIGHPTLERDARSNQDVRGAVDVFALTVLWHEAGSGRRSALRCRRRPLAAGPTPLIVSVGSLRLVPTGFSRAQAILLGSLRTASCHSTVNARQRERRPGLAGARQRRRAKRLGRAALRSRDQRPGEKREPQASDRVDRDCRRPKAPFFSRDRARGVDRDAWPAGLRPRSDELTKRILALRFEH